jgi:hypothetical protein
MQRVVLTSLWIGLKLLVFLTIARTAAPQFVYAGF